VKAMLREWEKQHPGRVESIFKALSNVTPSHLLDRQLHDFVKLVADDAVKDQVIFLTPHASRLIP
jgi:tRNA 2-thiocytidine biosynthesis protein TtcA